MIVFNSNKMDDWTYAGAYLPSWLTQFSFRVLSASILIEIDLLCVGQKCSFLGPPKTYKYMHRQYILIGQSFLNDSWQKQFWQWEQ